MTFTEFLAQRVRELEADRARLRARVRSLEKSRDRQRAARQSVRYCASCTKRVGRA